MGEEWTADLPAASHGRVRQLISNFCHVIPKCQCSYQAVKEYCRNPVHHISSSLWMKRERNLVQFCMLCIDKAGEAFLSACLSYFQREARESNGPALFFASQFIHQMSFFLSLFSL